MGTIKIRNVEGIGKKSEAKRDTPNAKRTASGFENYKNKVWREQGGDGYNWDALGREIEMNEGAGEGDINSQILNRLDDAKRCYEEARAWRQDGDEERAKEIMERCDYKLMKVIAYTEYFERFGYAYRNR